MSKWHEDTEQLTAAEFDAHIRNGTFRLSFVGPSNAGKTYRARVLESDADFLWYHVDGEIQKLLGFTDMNDISEWLGYPDSPTYTEREAAYLEAEEACTRLTHLDTDGKNLVFDTTGSVIYLSESAHRWLREHCFVVHLEVDEARIERMIEKFLDAPKPVAWFGTWEQEDGESLHETLKRSYPKLIEARLPHYYDLAHITVPLDELWDKSADETLAVIRSYLT